MAAKKRSRQDATLRNVRASKRRDATLGAKAKGLEERIAELERKLGELVHAFRSGLSRI